MLRNIEFFKTPDGEVLYRQHGESVKILSEHDREMVCDLLSLIRDRYPDALSSLSDIYSRSSMNRPWYEFKMVSRFIRCNLGDHDTQTIDIDDAGVVHFEQMKCPLMGSGDCQYENVICKPKLNTGLTAREMELVPMLADGMQAHEIATKMFLSKATVDNHRRNILAKLGLHSVTELAAWYHSQVKK